MEKIKNKEITNLLDKQESMIQTRDEIINIIRKENISLAQENKMLMDKLLKLQKKAT